MRRMLPGSGAVTNSAPPGPTALPWSSSRPVTSNCFSVAATCVAPSRLGEAGSLADGRDGDAGSPHAARAQTNTDENAMRCRIVHDLTRCGAETSAVGGQASGGRRASARAPAIEECGNGAKSPSRVALDRAERPAHYRAQQPFAGRLAW